MIPLLSLTALWILGISVTTRDSLNLLTVSSLYEEIGHPGDQLSVALQREHLLSAEYLGAPSERTQTELLRQRQQVDLLRQHMRRVALTESAQAGLSTPEMRARFSELMATIERLDATRAAVDTGAMDLVTLSRDFGQVPDAMQKLVVSMTVTGDLALYHRSQSLTAMGYAKDYLSRQRALAAGATIARRPLNPGELRTFAALATTRRFLFDRGMAELDPEVRAPFAALARSEDYRRLSAMESDIIVGAGRTFSHKVWRSVTDRVENAYQATLTRAGDALAASARPVAVGTFVRAGLAGALGLIAVVASLLVALRVGRRLTRELGDLRAAAAELADVRLPGIVRRLRDGENVDVSTEAPPLAVTATTSEVRDVASAFGSVQCTAVRAAVDEARLRDAVGEAFRNLARRSQSLLQRQLKLLDGMQRQVDDPETLRDLFRVDHLTTRMRRNAEGLVILSGAAPGRTFRKEVPVMDALRAAVGEVEDYTRVRVHPMPEALIVGNAVADVIHLCAELIENATAFSPPATEVSVHGEFVAHGFAVEIEDRGLGLSTEERDALNTKLSRPPEFDPADTKRLGLYVIGRLAARHDIRVELRASPYGGTTAIVLLPDRLVAMPERPVANPARPTPPPARTVILPTGRSRNFFDEPPASPPPAAFAPHAGPATGPTAPPAGSVSDSTGSFTRPAGPATGPNGSFTGPAGPFGDPSDSVADPVEAPADPAGAEHAVPRPHDRPARSAGDPAGPSATPADSSRGPAARQGTGPAAASPAAPPATALPPGAPPPAVPSAHPPRPASGGTSPAPSGPGKGALPRRVRQASLAPQLRPADGQREPGHGARPDTPANGKGGEEQTSAQSAGMAGGIPAPDAAPASGPAATAGERSPEQSRALLNTLRSGWRRGLADNERDGEEV
ncbi:nitrate- and nitrite sensing domain-containing protein [Sphaerisporangium melleum]|uniref:sensor histidine kinase n=1 Tax=Sphaerisporangium melleum TaxID=321316 RepID=UPI001E4D5301|nr:nitrate- and nitrite sensing domain-containing protein [Sphaerisporangium melleum]